MKTQAYVKGMLLGFALVVFMLAPVVSLTSMQLQYPQAIAAESSMAEIQLILKKLRMSMSSMKDFDALEKAGMSKKDVNRMRRAMTQKIQELTNDAIDSIRNI